MELPGNPKIPDAIQKEISSKPRWTEGAKQEENYLIESNLLLNTRFKMIISPIKSNGVGRWNAMNNPVLCTRPKWRGNRMRCEELWCDEVARLIDTFQSQFQWLYFTSFMMLFAFISFSFLFISRPTPAQNINIYITRIPYIFISSSYT